MKPIIVLIASSLICAMIVYFGPSAAAALLPPFGLDAEDASLAGIETVYAIVIYGGLLVLALGGGALSGGNPLRLGNKPASSALAGGILGLAGVLAAAAYAWLANTLTAAPPSEQQSAFVWGTLIVLLQASSEEVYFRGWLQPVLAERWGALVAILVAALAFAGLHVLGGARSPVTLVNLFLGGLLFGALAYYRAGIAGAIAAHFAWNWAEQMLLGLIPNPGLGSFGALYDLELAGAAAWGGSEEGLNASLAMTITLCALLIPVLLLIRGRTPLPIRSAPIG